jgi:hypothetical protein
MAKLPTVQDMGGRYIPGPSTSIRGLRGGEAVGAAVEQLGKVGQEIGFNALDREATALAKERDTFAADQIRDLMYNPETGFANQKGRNAMDAAASTDERLAKIEEEASRGLSSVASQKLTAQIARRMEGARNTIAQHTSRERDTWATGASEARMVSAVQDALFDPSTTAASIATIEGEMIDMQGRQGWSDEERDIEIAGRVSGLYQEQIETMAAVDPISAYDYFLLKKDDMLPEVANDIRPRLKRDAMQETGRQQGAAAYEAYKAASSPSSPEAYRVAIAAVESRGSGDYNARGGVIENPDSMYYGERALGRYQIMPGNLPEWSKAALGREVSEEEFMASPELQDKIFDHRFGILVDRYGNARDAASAWFTGGPLSVGGDKSDGNIKGREYVRRFDEALGGLGSGYGGKTPNQIEKELLDQRDPDMSSAAVRAFSQRIALDRQNKTAQKNEALTGAMAAIWQQKQAPEDMDPAMQKALKDNGLWDLAGEQHDAMLKGAQQNNNWDWLNSNYNNLTPDERLKVPAETLLANMTYEKFSAEMTARQDGKSAEPRQKTAALISGRLGQLSIDVNSDKPAMRARVDDFYESYDATVAEFTKERGRSPNAFEEQEIVNDVTAKWDLYYTDRLGPINTMDERAAFEVMTEENLANLADVTGFSAEEVTSAIIVMEDRGEVMNKRNLIRVLNMGLRGAEPADQVSTGPTPVSGAGQMLRGG